MGASQSVEAKEPVPQQPIDDRVAALLSVLLKSSPRVQKGLLRNLFNTIKQLEARNEDLVSKCNCTDSNSFGQWVVFVGGMVSTIIAFVSLVFLGANENWLVDEEEV